MKFNHLNVPTHWRNYWSRYPEGHTILEALISWVSQVDSMVDNQNKLNDNVEQFRNEIDAFVERFDESLQDEVTQTLKDWQTSGFLDVVISEAIEWELDDFKATTEQNFLSVNQEFNRQLAKKVTYHKLDVVEGEDITDKFNEQILLHDWIYIPTGTYKVSQIGLQLIRLKNKRVLCDGILIQETNSIRDASIFVVDNSENIIIENATMIGDLGTHQGTEGEHGHGVRVFSSTGVKLINLKISKTWGDGISIGVDWYDVTSIKHATCEIINPIIDNCSRNGITIGMGDVTIEGGVISNINRVFPKAGIDIEPEGNAQMPVLGNVYINNLKTVNCGDTGIKTELYNVSEATQGGVPLNIIINDHIDIGSAKGVHFVGQTNYKRGVFEYNNGKLYESKTSGVYIRKWNANCVPLKIVKPYIYNACTSLTNDNYYSQAISLFDTESLVKTENVDIIEPTVIDDRVVKKVRVPLGAENPNGIVINYLNPVKTTSLKPYPHFISGASDYRIRIEDKFKTMHYDTELWGAFIGCGANIMATYVTNTNSVENSYCIVKSNYPENTRLTFEVTKAKWLTVGCDGMFLGYTTVGQALKSNTLGSTLVVEKRGTNLIVVTMTGEWVAGTA